MTSVIELAGMFESLQFSIPVEECPDDFLMLLASSVVDVCHTLNHPFAEELISPNGHDPKKSQIERSCADK